MREEGQRKDSGWWEEGERKGGGRWEEVPHNVEMVSRPPRGSGNRSFWAVLWGLIKDIWSNHGKIVVKSL